MATNDLVRQLQNGDKSAFRPLVEVYQADILSLYFRGPAVGAAQPGNDPAPLYVVVEDKAGHKKTVIHPNPEATLAATWQQWQIPLSDLTLAGINLASITKMSIGVGSRTSPIPGAAGVLYIDDIGVGHPAQ